MLTELERIAIKAIINSDYQDGNEGREVIDHPVWSFSVTNAIPGNKSSRGGVIASLVKKEYVKLLSYEEENDAMQLTEKGYEAFTK